MMAKVFRVSGRVQGVGFRWATQERAQSLGLAGWVRNDADGAVSGLVQGEAEAVEAFHFWLGRGPSSAQVKNVVWNDTVVTGLRVFSIRP